MEKKIVFFDIDGTIYMYGEKVPKDTRCAIRELRRRGHYAVLCTGRTKSMVYPEIYEIGFDGIIGGAGTYVEFQNRILHQYNLPESFSDKIIEDMFESKIIPIPEGIENIYFDLSNVPLRYKEIYELYRDKVPKHVKNVRTSERIVVSKLSGMLTDCEKGEKFIEKYQEYFNIILHTPKYIEMIPNGYSKAVGIERLINAIPIGIENTYAFGDGMNDYEMLRYVRYGVVMGNAAEEFKAKMTYVTEDYDKGGISNALRRFQLID